MAPGHTASYHFFFSFFLFLPVGLLTMTLVLALWFPAAFIRVLYIYIYIYIYICVCVCVYVYIYIYIYLIYPAELKTRPTGCSVSMTSLVQSSELCLLTRLQLVLPYPVYAVWFDYKAVVSFIVSVLPVVPLFVFTTRLQLVFLQTTHIVRIVRLFIFFLPQSCICFSCSYPYIVHLFMFFTTRLHLVFF